MRVALVIPIVGLLVFPVVGCSGSGNDPDAQQLARINKELALLNEQMSALTGRVEQLERRERDARSAAQHAPTSPGAGAKTLEPKADAAIVSVAASGAISIDGAPVEMDRLADALRPQDGGKARSLTIRIAPEAPHATVVAIMDLAKQQGIDAIAVVQGTIEPDVGEPR